MVAPCPSGRTTQYIRLRPQLGLRPYPVFRYAHQDIGYTKRYVKLNVIFHFS